MAAIAGRPKVPRLLLGCTRPLRANAAFAALAATTCDPLAPAPGCIPFNFPDDGALGRAHEACKRLTAMGLKPRKIWIQGTLVAATRNNPDCAVHLSLNVAPALCVSPRLFLFPRRTLVLDPTLFATPVSVAVWKAAHSDDAATLTQTGPEVFDLLQGLTDPSNELSDQALADARTALQSRSAQVGPPPYAACP